MCVLCLITEQINLVTGYLIIYWANTIITGQSIYSEY